MQRHCAFRQDTHRKALEAGVQACLRVPRGGRDAGRRPSCGRTGWTVLCLLGGRLADCHHGRRDEGYGYFHPRPRATPADFTRRSQSGQFFIYCMTLTGILVNRLSSAGTQFLNDDDGAALAEYGILVAFIAIVAIVAVTFFGSKVSAKFSEYATKV